MTAGTERSITRAELPWAGLLKASVIAIALLAAGCSSSVPGQTGGGGPQDGKNDDPVADDDDEPAGLIVEPDVINLDVDESIPMSAKLVDDNDNVLDLEVEPTWSSTDGEIADVTPEGLLTGKRAGGVRITALVDGFQAQARVTVGTAIEPECDNPMFVCGQRYFSCDAGETWQETSEGACSVDNPEDCTCGEYLRLFHGGENPDSLGYCSESEPPGGFAETCDCNYCVEE